MDKVLNKDQGNGILERAMYGAFTAFAMKLVAWGWFTADEAPWIAGGLMTAAGGAYAWWHNRPAKVLDRAADALPRNNVLVVTPTPEASHADKQEAKTLADSAGPKVIAKA